MDRNSMFGAARDGDMQRLMRCVGRMRKNKARRLTSEPKDDGLTPLAVACKNGHVDVVEYLIDECGADVELNAGIRAPPPAPPLWWASANGHLNVVHFLLSRGANINGVSASGRSVVYVACLNGNLEMVKYLVENGADIEAADINGVTCLGLACHEDHYQIATYLMRMDSKGRLILKSLFWLSTMFTLMQSHGKHVDFEVIMSVFVVVVNAIEVQTKSGENGGYFDDEVALHLIGCITRMQPELSEEQNKSFGEVLRRYVRFDRDKQGGVTPLHVIFFHTPLDMICFRKATDKADLHPYSVVDVVKQLLDAGADPLAVDHHLNTPLHYVARARPIRLNIIRLLLDRGAHFDAKNADGKCFLDIIAPEERAQFNSAEFTTLKSLAADAVKKNDTDDQDELAHSLSNVALVKVTSGMKVGEPKVEVQDVSMPI